MYASDSRMSSLARASGYSGQRSEGKASGGSEAAQRDNRAERCGDAGEIIIILEEGGQQADCAIVLWTGCPVTRVGRHEARHGLTQTTMLDTQPCIDNEPAAPPQGRMLTELSHGRATLGQQMQQRARQLRKPVCRQAAEPA